MIRIIPRLDIKGPNVIKGLSFEGYRVVGKSETLAEYYYNQGADELFFQDTVASLYERNNLLEIVSLSAGNVMIPITVSGGMRNLEDIKATLNAGADKVAINTAAIKDPNIIKEASRMFGSQCIVLSVEAKKVNDNLYEPWFDYGREPSGLNVEEWVKTAQELGVGEIYLSSVDKDGSGNGFDQNLIKKVSKICSVPLIACSGAGSYEDFYNLASETTVDALSAASVFHYDFLNIKKIKSDNKKSLRMGEQQDTGNFEFIEEGYGGFNNIQVKKCSIPNLKKFLIDKKIKVRI